MLTGRSGNLVEFRHVLTENSQEKNDHLHCLSQCLKKLQNDVNSCLTDIINQESTSTVPAKGNNHFGQYKRWTADCGLRTADWV